MNIEEITNEIKNKLDELILSFEKLKNTIEAEKVKEWRNNLDKTRWRAKLDKNYYHIFHNSGEIIEIVDVRIDSDDWNYKIGNYFKTRKEAERYKEKLIIEQELKDLALELNTEPIDKGNKYQDRNCIYYDHESKCFGQYYFVMVDHNNIYCTSDNFLKEALKRIGEDRLKILFEVEK
jgi:hypothetical protein